MDSLRKEQEVRLECIIAATNFSIAMIESQNTVIDIYEKSEEMYEYVMEGKIPNKPEWN